MTPDQLTEIGQLLYGQHWKGRLAEALGRDKSAITRWLGGGTIPETAARRIRTLSTTSTKEPNQ